MKKIFVSFICLRMLTFCETTEYPIESYKISNVVDGKYTVVYQQRTGFPDNSVDIELKKSDDIIYK